MEMNMFDRLYRFDMFYRFDRFDRFDRLNLTDLTRLTGWAGLTGLIGLKAWKALERLIVTGLRTEEASTRDPTHLITKNWSTSKFVLHSRLFIFFMSYLQFEEF